MLSRKTFTVGENNAATRLPANQKMFASRGIAEQASHAEAESRAQRRIRVVGKILKDHLAEAAPDVAALPSLKWLQDLFMRAPDEDVKTWAFVAFSNAVLKENAEQAQERLARQVRQTDFDLLVRIAECTEFIDRQN